MKKLICKNCSGKWIVSNEDYYNLKKCPYCSNQLFEKRNFSEIDSLDKAIYNAIERWGVEVFQNPQKLSGYMLDMVPELKKEIRIFSKALLPQFVKYVIDAFNGKESEAIIQFKKLKEELIDNEGLSDAWGELIYKSLYNTYSYMYLDEARITLVGALSETFLPTSENSVKSGEHVKGSDTQRKMKTASKKQIKISDSLLNQQAEEYMRVRDYGQAMEIYRELANSGDVSAMNQIAIIYFREGNNKKAWKWFLKAADHGNAEAQYYVGLFNEKPIYVARNITVAIRYYKQSASKGNKKAKESLERMARSMNSFDKKRYNL
ncbi:MAG: tetratricopeptide repeat protein [Ruminococcus sp.]|nr:tetratricopeptide repeat protein [Ruminococcus sp.]